jgi:RimJ/RimL family protein N-acetyltransferase
VLCLDAERVGPWVCDRAGGSWVRGRGTAIGKLSDGELVAGVLYEDFTGANIVCHIAGVGNWATRHFLAVIFDYPFQQMKVRRITVPVDSVNNRSIRLVERMGFSLESVLREATPSGDMLIYRMFRDECKFLRGRYAQSLARHP